MKILIAGCAGQLGRSLVAALVNDEVQGADRDRLDITRLADVRQAITTFTPDLVINSAAYNDVDGAESNTAQAYRINALGPRNLALATAAAGIPLLHVSTDYVFDGAADRPYHEFDLPRPLSAYGLSKLAGEIAVKELNCRHYIVRTAWLFHPAGRNFLKTMRSLSQRPQVKAVSDQYGSPTYAPHLAQAISELIRSEAYGVYHLAGQGGASRFELTRMLFCSLGLETEVVPVSHAEFPAPAPRPHNSVLTTAQEPAIVLPPWQEGVRAYARALR
ncbi:MAG TPA: dTDP-4-dehydrorhamnose reductase [Candidatus Binataceae bacterium]|nr:dTDP-4-dehydrorhamnose reductase [Candidatus Binataceae bacterium]